MRDVLLTRELRAELHHPSEIAGLARRGELTHLRRGSWSSKAAEDAEAGHRQLIRATVPQISSDAVLSHVSAGLLYGLPLLNSRLDQVHWTRSRYGGGRSHPQIHVYAAPLAPHEIVRREGFKVTSLERTVVDLARHLPFAEAVMIADSALHLGLARPLLTDSLDSARRRPGQGSARRVVAFADGRSESAGESWSRVQFASIGLPPSHLQYEVFDENGELVGRSDFCWEEQRVLGEFDGLIKYEKLLRPGERASDVVVREKLREDRLRELDWTLIRWTWRELPKTDVLRGRLTRAIDGAARFRPAA